MITVGTTALLFYDPTQGRFPDSVVLGQTKKPGYEGLWMTPGGRVNEFEIARDAIRREIKEELNHEIHSLMTKKVHEHVDRALQRHWIFFCYQGYLDPTIPLVMNSDFIHGRIFRWDEVVELHNKKLLTPITHGFIEDYISGRLHF